MVAVGLWVTAGLATASTPPTVSVLVVPRFAPAEHAAAGAVGLFVPGSGKTVSRRSALASLVRGKVVTSDLGGVPSGKPLIRLGKHPAELTIYVALPPPGRHPNTVRYPIAIVGGDYHGLLTSRSTRIPGLVSIADVAPTAVALDTGRQPLIRSRPEARPASTLARLDRRLSDARSARTPATVILVAIALAAALIGLALGSPYLSRAGLLAAPGAAAAAVFVSAIGVTTPWQTLLLLALLTAGGALVLAASPRLLLPAFAAWIVAYLVALVGWPSVVSLAAIGPHPDGGGRFYGITNMTSGVLLSVALVAASLAGLRWLPAVALLALVTDGWSRAGADGGGTIVLLAAFLVLGVRLAGLRLTPLRIAALVAATLGAGLAGVGLDAATGGSSHVTRTVRRGPGALAGEFAHRIHISAAFLWSSWTAAIVFAVSVSALIWLATRGPRFPAGDALIAGVIVSLLVNDSPADIAAAGAVSYGVLWGWRRVCDRASPAARLDSRPMRRAAPVLLALGLLFGAAACGSGSIVAPTAKTVVGTLPTGGGGNAADGKKLYTSLGCQGCHTLDGTKSAGPTFKGLYGSQVKLADGTTVKADDQYLLESITDPDKQIAAGYQPGVMSAVIKPGQVSQSDAQSLVAFIKSVK